MKWISSKGHTKKYIFDAAQWDKNSKYKYRKPKSCFVKFKIPLCYKEYWYCQLTLVGTAALSGS